MFNHSFLVIHYPLLLLRYFLNDTIGLNTISNKSFEVFEGTTLLIHLKYIISRVVGYVASYNSLFKHYPPRIDIPGSRGHLNILRISQKCLTSIRKSPISLVYPWDVYWISIILEYPMDIQRITGCCLG